MEDKDEPKYFAVPDPDTGAMTYWFKNKRGQLQPWPKAAKYAPQLWKKPGEGRVHVMPADLSGSARTAYVRNWFATVHRSWMNQIKTAIHDNPDDAATRFAAFSSRCCVCGKSLTDASSKVYGIGPECRSGWPAAILEQMARQMGEIHAESLRKGETSH